MVEPSSRDSDPLGTGRQIRIGLRKRKRPVRYAVTGGFEAMDPEIVSCSIRFHEGHAIGALGRSDS